MSVDRSEIERLIEELGADTDSAEGAQAGLIRIGTRVVDPLSERALDLPPFGKLCAIEVFRGVGDPRAGRVLTAMLRDEDETVREWGAGALGELRVVEAVPDLERLYDEIKRSDLPLDWTLPVAVRLALTDLGARKVVMPSTVAELARADDELDSFWEPDVLARVVSDLADARQLVLFCSYWRRWNDSYTSTYTPQWEIEWGLPWDELVESTRRAAVAAIEDVGTPADTVAALEWMDRRDDR